MNKLPITVMVPTINAAGHLDELLDSVLEAVEAVFVVDSLSTDRTVEIARRRGVQIVQRPFVTSSDQFGWMLQRLPVITPWIFFMAQDERMSAGLRDELFAVLAHDNGEFNGYTVQWRLWFMGKPLHAKSDNLRLMRTGKCNVTQVACNEHFLVDGKIGRLQGVLEHKDSLTLYDWYEKQNIWTTREAVGRLRDRESGEEPNLFGTGLQRKMFFKRLLNALPGGNFAMFWYYFLKFGAWKDGVNGWLWASLRVWAHRAVQLKIREIRTLGKYPELPEARHGDFDPVIMASPLQRQLLPELVDAWEKTHGKNQK